MFSKDDLIDFADWWHNKEYLYDYETITVDEALEKEFFKWAEIAHPELGWRDIGGPYDTTTH